MDKEYTIATKPLWRGYLHQAAFFISLGACTLLIAKSTNSLSGVASTVYSLGLLLMFGTSALYHRLNWAPSMRAIMKRLDHSAIFIMIAGSMTPFSLLALPTDAGKKLLLVIWAAAALGVIQSIFWTKAPIWITTIFYLAMGWLVFPFLPELMQNLGLTNMTFLFSGGLLYSVGAMVYATKRPQLSPTIFGYHEFFHAFTIVAAILHFIVIFRLVL